MFSKSFLLFLVLFMLSCGNAPKVTNSENVPKIEEQTIDITTFEMTVPASSNSIGNRSMGKAKSGEKLEDRFALKNATDKPIVILEARTNCGCVTVDYSKEPIKAGDKKTIKYTYDSKGKMGQQFSQITINTNVGEYKVVVDLLVE